MNTRIELVESPTDDLVAAVAHLLPQLGLTRAVPTRETLDAMVRTPGNTLYVCRLDDRVVGMLTLTVIRAVDGRVTALVEDVVVDANARRLGVGSALVDAAIQGAREAGAKRILLRSSRSREAAHRLYRRHGFEERPSPVLGLDVGADR